MKKIVLLACLIFLAVAINAQTPSALPIGQPKPSFGFKSKLTPPFLLPGSQKLPYQPIAQAGSTKTVYNINNMPVAGMGEVTLNYKGNNGNGLSVYSATPDNMPIVKPDSTVYFTTPVAGTQHWPPAQNR